jgi:hypothetical protein
MRRARAGLAIPFKVATHDVPPIALVRLVELKKVRNAFMHEGKAKVDFEAFFANVVALVCHLHFMCVPTDVRIRAFPFHDFLETFGERFWDEEGELRVLEAYLRA